MQGHAVLQALLSLDADILPARSRNQSLQLDWSLVIISAVFHSVCILQAKLCPICFFKQLMKCNFENAGLNWDHSTEKEDHAIMLSQDMMG